MVGLFLYLAPIAALFALFIFLQLFLFRVLLRWQWLAVAVLVLLDSAADLASDHATIDTSNDLILSGLAVFMLIRFGALAFAVVPMILFLLVGFPLNSNFSTWYAGSGIFALAVVLALTAYAFHTAVAGRPVFSAGFLERD
jgi:hypothetical protein